MVNIDNAECLVTAVLEDVKSNSLSVSVGVEMIMNLVRVANNESLVHPAVHFDESDTCNIGSIK